MAARVAASVVWLTVAVIMTATPGLDSGFTGSLAALPIGFASDFLFVTGAFNFTGTDFAAALGKGLAATVLTDVFRVAGITLATTPLGCTLATLFKGLLDDFAVFVGGADLADGRLEATVFFGTGFAIALTAGFDKPGFAFFATCFTVFAGFFIEFAMKSTTNQVVLVAQSDALPVPKNRTRK